MFGETLVFGKFILLSGLRRPDPAKWRSDWPCVVVKLAEGWRSDWPWVAVGPAILKSEIFAIGKKITYGGM